MKKLTIALLAIAAVAGQAQIKQTWTETLTDPSLNYWVESTAIATNGSVFTLSMADGYNTRLTSHDGLGNLQWTKTYSTMDTDEGGRLIADAQGNILFLYRTPVGNAHVMKVDGTSGGALWNASVPARQVDAIEVDGSGNIVILGYNGGATDGPVVYKISPDGVLLQSRETTPETQGYRPRRLAVSANGQIYTVSWKSINGTTYERLEALTPNFTVRYANTWAGNNYGAQLDLASDRNGRVCVTEIQSGNNPSLQVRTFSSNGTPTLVALPIAGVGIYENNADFDANGRLVVGSSGFQNGLYFSDVRWFSVTDTTVSPIQRSKVSFTADHGFWIRKLVCDSFGQTYLTGVLSGTVPKTATYAFDESRTAPIWDRAESFPISSSPRYDATVGRWGQVASVASFGDPTSEVGVAYIKQLGLRNLLINGQSFTGGRTITGTVNFYSSDTMDRTVNMTSNTSYAIIAPTKTVTAGASQAGMSIELKPTSVRRAVRIEGTFGGAKRSALFYIEPPVASGLTVYPTSVKGGTNVNGSARINGAAPTGGMVVNISSSDAAAVVPNSVTVAEGAVTKAFTVNTNVVSQQKTVTLTATTGTTSKTATLTITP